MFDEVDVLDDVEFEPDAVLPDIALPDDALPDMELPDAVLEDGCPAVPLCPLDIDPDGGVPLAPGVDAVPDVWPNAGSANPIATKAAASDVLLSFLSIM